MRSVTRLVAFFAAGALMVGLGRLDARPELVVRVPGDASSDAIAAAIDEALLVELGLPGWRSDALIMDRLGRIAATAGLDVADAEALDLLRRDPLVRARLVERARLQLERVPSPSEAELAAFYATHHARFERPPMFRIEHVAARPDLTLGATATRTEAQLARSLGVDGARAVASAEPNVWLTLGDRRIRVLARIAAEIPPLAQIHAEVLGAWRDDARARARSDGLRRIRAAVEVQLQVAGP